jgi:hypothetical protein
VLWLSEDDEEDDSENELDGHPVGDELWGSVLELQSVALIKCVPLSETEMDWLAVWLLPGDTLAHAVIDGLW